ncbi:hypothetical protein ACFQMA_19485 [Halosimplex aquaticum]|uniref:Uncharacterized protein n=1 Tax=Halosimplex aquaticum TaxID=3026162 RepID=A0ABD5Y3U6_9EURY|nr:hypothetical protein [Halosimplex aquaticum]
MIGIDSFCPKSGAALTRDRHYDERGRSKRAVTATDGSSATGTVGELTNGAVRSAQTALLAYFRRCHARHAEPADDLYRRASLALRRLKSSADGRQEWDVHVWLALNRRLDATGYDVDWMHCHTAIRCPGCHGRLRFRTTDSGTVVARCGVDCDGQTGDALVEIRETLASLYADAFDGEDCPGPEEFLQF